MPSCPFAYCSPHLWWLGKAFSCLPKICCISHRTRHDDPRSFWAIQKRQVVDTFLMSGLAAGGEGVAGDPVPGDGRSNAVQVSQCDGDLSAHVCTWRHAAGLWGGYLRAAAPPLWGCRRGPYHYGPEVRLDQPHPRRSPCRPRTVGCHASFFRAHATVLCQGKAHQT